MKKSDLTHQVSRAVAWNTLLAPIKTITEVITNIVILNVLPLPHIGLLRLMSSAAASLGIWVDGGIDRSLPRFIPEIEQTQGRTGVGRFMAIIFAIKTLLLVFFSIVFFFFSHHFTNLLLQRVQELPERFADARTILEQDMVQLAPWLIATVIALVVLGSFYDGLMAYLISYFRQRAWNLIGLVGSILQPLLATVLVLLGKGVLGVLFAMVLTPVISVALAGWQVLKQFVRGKQYKAASSTEHDIAPLPWKRFAIYTAMSNVLNLSDYLVSWYFATFLLRNLADVALYTTGTAMVRQALALLYTPLVGIQVPLFTRVRGGEGHLPDTYAAIGRILAFVLIPGGVGLALLSRELIFVQYPQYTEAALVIYLLTPCLFLESFLSSAQIVLQVYERYPLLILPRVLILFILPILVWVAPAYGLIGVTLAIGVGRVAIGLATALLAQRTFPLRYSWPFFGRLMLATFGMSIVVLALKHLLNIDHIGAQLTARLIAGGLLMIVASAGILTFGILFRLMGGLEPEDRQQMMQSRLPLRRWLVKLL